jgi:hypothetical protein
MGIMDAIDRELLLTTTAPREDLGLVTRCQQFDEIMVGLNKERSDVYGHPLDDFHNNAIGMEVINKCADPEIRHALAMIWVKVCRLVNTPEHFDTAADAAGYARTICMIIDERERRAINAAN